MSSTTRKYEDTLTTQAIDIVKLNDKYTDELKNKSNLSNSSQKNVFVIFNVTCATENDNNLNVQNDRIENDDNCDIINSNNNISISTSSDDSKNVINFISLMYNEHVDVPRRLSKVGNITANEISHNKNEQSNEYEYEEVNDDSDDNFVIYRSRHQIKKKTR